MNKNPYKNIKEKDTVVFCESGMRIPCTVEKIYYKDNNGHGQLKCYKLHPIKKDVFTESFVVTTTCGEGSVWCPWYFME